MIPVEQTVLVLLAAGKSERFGDIGSKLDELFLSRPLGLHVAVTLEDVPFKERVAITNGAEIDFAAHRFTIMIPIATWPRRCGWGWSARAMPGRRR